MSIAGAETLNVRPKTLQKHRNQLLQRFSPICRVYFSIFEAVFVLVRSRLTWKQMEIHISEKSYF